MSLSPDALASVLQSPLDEQLYDQVARRCKKFNIQADKVIKLLILGWLIQDEEASAAFIEDLEEIFNSVEYETDFERFRVDLEKVYDSFGHEIDMIIQKEGVKRARNHRKNK